MFEADVGTGGGVSGGEGGFDGGCGLPVDGWGRETAPRALPEEDLEAGRRERKATHD